MRACRAPRRSGSRPCALPSHPGATGGSERVKKADRGSRANGAGEGGAGPASDPPSCHALLWAGSGPARTPRRSAGPPDEASGEEWSPPAGGRPVAFRATVWTHSPLSTAWDKAEGCLVCLFSTYRCAGFSGSIAILRSDPPTSPRALNSPANAAPALPPQRLGQFFAASRALACGLELRPSSRRPSGSGCASGRVPMRSRQTRTSWTGRGRLSRCSCPAAMACRS